jgi:hypothetical protein
MEILLQHPQCTLHVVLPPQVIERLVEIRTYGHYLRCAECQIEDQAWAEGEGTVDQVASCSGQRKGYLQGKST